MQNESSSMSDAFTAASYELKIGLTVRALRNFFGMSQSDLAALSGVSRPTLSSLEKGNTSRHANVETLERLVSFFRSVGVTIEIREEELVYKFSKDAVALAVSPKVASSL